MLFRSSVSSDSYEKDAGLGIPSPISARSALGNGQLGDVHLRRPTTSSSSTEGIFNEGHKHWSVSVKSTHMERKRWLHVETTASMLCCISKSMLRDRFLLRSKKRSTDPEPHEVRSRFVQNSADVRIHSLNRRQTSERSRMTTREPTNRFS